MMLSLARRIDPYSKQGGKLGVATITGATGTSTVTITAVGHGFQTDDIVLIAGVTVITNVNGTHTITVTGTNTFTFVPGSAAAGTYGSGGTATSICVSDGEKFTKERLLDIYNQARLALFSALMTKYGEEKTIEAISGAVTESQVSFTAAGNRYTSALPTGYARFVGLEGFSGDASGVITPIKKLPVPAIQNVRRESYQYQQSSKERFVFEIGTNLVHYGNYLGHQTLTGTAWEVRTGKKVTGTGTLFLSELSVGSQIFMDFTADPSIVKTVESIESNTSLTVSVAFSANATGTTIRKILTGAGWEATATTISTKTVVVTGGAAITELVEGSTVILDSTEKVIDEILADNTFTVTEVFAAADSGTTVAMQLRGTSFIGSGDSLTCDSVDAHFLTDVKSGNVLTITLTGGGTLSKTVDYVDADNTIIVTVVFASDITATGITKACSGSAWAVTFDYSGLLSRGAQFTSQLHILSAITLVRLNETTEAVTVGSITDDENLVLVEEFASPTDSGYAMSIALSGSVWTASAATPDGVFGTSTLFLTELNIGDTIRLYHSDGSYLDKIVESIESNTGLTVTVAFSGADEGDSIGVANHTLRYIGISNFTLADVTGAATLETFNLDFEPKILEVAEKVSMEQGSVDLKKIALALV